MSHEITVVLCDNETGVIIIPSFALRNIILYPVHDFSMTFAIVITCFLSVFNVDIYFFLCFSRRCLYWRFAFVQAAARKRECPLFACFFTKQNLVIFYDKNASSESGAFFLKIYYGIAALIFRVDSVLYIVITSRSVRYVYNFFVVCHTDFVLSCSRII